MDVKMDNVNFDSIFDNLNLHAKPMDSSTKNGIDTRRDLGVYRKNGKEEQKGKDSIQRNSSSIPDRQKYFRSQKSQCTPETNNIEGEWGHDHYSNPTGCHLLFVHDQFKLPKEEKNKEKSQETAEIVFLAPRPNKYKEENKEESKGKSQEIPETGRVTLSAPRPNLSMDIYIRRQSQQATTHSQRFLESRPEKYFKPCIWCNNHSLQLERQERIVRNPTKERQIPSSSGRVWECYTEIGRLGVRELLGNECMDLFMPVETRSPNQVSNNNSTQQKDKGTMQKLQRYSEMVKKLKNDREFREFHEPTDKELIDQENREYFNKTYGITSIHPLFVDHSGIVLLFLDDRGIMFMWSEIEYGMRILGINKLEGLANYLYHSDKICVVMEDTGELVPEVELTRRVKEKMELEEKKLAEKNREKRLAKKKRLAEKKRKSKSDMGVLL